MFYHRWKGLVNLHEKSWSRISFLNSLLLSAGCNRRYFMIGRYARGSISRASYVELDKVFTTVGKVWSISMRKVVQKSPFAPLSSCQGGDTMSIFRFIEMMQHGDCSPDQTTLSLTEILPPLERSDRAPWRKLIEILLSHRSPFVRSENRRVLLATHNQRPSD